MNKTNERSRLKSALATIIPLVKYALLRLVQMIPVLLIISFILFLIVQSMPGDPVWAYVDPERPIDPGYLDQLRQELGLVGPMHERYLKWIGRLLQGDFGYSTSLRKDVADIIPFYLKNTLLVNIVSFIVALVFSIVVGIRSAVNRYSFFDKFFTVFSIAGISLPSFFFAMLLIFAFVITIPLFPFAGMYDVRATYADGSFAQFLDLAHHMVLPVLVSVMGTSSTLIRYVRNSMLEVLKQDYIRTARSKGLKDKVIIYRHAFRNALIPVLTLIGFYIPALFSGSVLVENIFAWPGIGNLLRSAYDAKDQQIILTITLFYSVITLLSNLLVDLSYGFADPRVRIGGSKND